MNRIAFASLVFAAACAGPRPLPHTEIPPALPPVTELPPPRPAVTDEAATQRWLDEQIARQRGVRNQTAPQPGPEQEPRPEQESRPERAPLERQSPTNEDATRAWLDRTVEERRAANPDRPPEPIYQERTVYVDRPYYVRGYGYDAWGEPLYGSSWDYGNGNGYYPGRYESTFPVNTAVGAGIGAIIGNQSHHRGRGAAIGAGIGLLFDLARWHR